MEDKPLISIILPVYNARKYINKTIESIINQTYTNFELIIIVDGSSDGSREICEEFASKDSRINIIYQENKGICYSRNKGINMSSGRYIVFCDHDDIYLPTYLEDALFGISDKDYDVVKFNYISYLVKNGITKKNKKYMLSSGIYSTNCSYDCLNSITKAVWNGIYKKDFLVNNNINYDLNLKAGMEDYDFNFKLLSANPKLYLSDKKLYIHFNRQNQSTFVKYNKNRIYDILNISNIELNYIMSTNLKNCEIFNDHQLNYFLLIIKEFMFKECKVKYSERIKIIKKFKSTYSKIYRSDIKSLIRFLHRNSFLQNCAFIIYKLNFSFIYLLLFIFKPFKW